jgi:hypothetical protein
VRFTIRADNGACLEILYVLERDHHPLSKGTLEFALGVGQFVSSPPEDVLRRQAEAYVESYLRRSREASTGLR